MTNFEMIQNASPEQMEKIIRERASACLMCGYYSSCRLGANVMFCELREWLKKDADNE